MGRTYREAGVDIDEARRAVELIGQAAASTATPAVLGGVGGFGSLFQLDTGPYPFPVLVASTDGVGTKLKVAIALGRHDTIGIDLVHHCINDIAVQGADPLFFLDYLATGRLRADVAEEIVAGIAAACAASGVALVGGETAELPDLYQGDDFDLAGFIVGVVARRDVIDGSGRASRRRAARPAVIGPAHQRLFAGAPGAAAGRVGQAGVGDRADASARSCSSRIGPTWTRSASCAGPCAKRGRTCWPSRTSPAAAGSTTSRARCRLSSASRSRPAPGGCRASSA